MKMKTILLLTVAMTWSTLISCSSMPAAQDSIVTGKSTGQIKVDNTTRSFIVYLPENFNKAQKHPVIFLFHGGGSKAGSMLNISRGTDFKSLSEENGIILVAPQGIEKSWNDGRKTKANKLNIDDVKFISQLLKYIIDKYSVDTTRIYATGISNGGFMVSRLGCEIGYKFAAIAVVAATMGKDIPYSTCTPDFTLPVMYIHGTADPIIPFDGGEKSIGAEGAFVSHQQVIDKWVAINKCNPVPITTQLPNTAFDGTTVTEQVYSSRINNANVISLIVNNGGHTWPGGKQYLPKFLIGRVSRDINACEMIWKFFSEYKR
jgi:polyhydroxybutyrate depolymerase